MCVEDLPIHLWSIGPPYGDVRCVWMQHDIVLNPWKLLVGLAETFSSKTWSLKGPGALVLLPTRELASQARVVTLTRNDDLNLKSDEVSPKMSKTIFCSSTGTSQPFLWVWTCKRNTFGWLHIEQVHPLNKELSLNDSTLSLEFHTSASEVSSQASNCLVIGSYKIGTHGLERISLAPASKYSK